VLEVTDTGLGVSLLALPRLFDSFQSTKKQGMGMGLSITRTIIQAHGGHIEAANCDFGGARFTVTLPALPMRDLPAAAPVPAALATMEKA
jgi:two-component system sensor kinase FixL